MSRNQDLMTRVKSMNLAQYLRLFLLLFVLSACREATKVPSGEGMSVMSAGGEAGEMGGR